MHRMDVAYCNRHSILCDTDTQTDQGLSVCLCLGHMAMSSKNG